MKTLFGVTNSDNWLLGHRGLKPRNDKIAMSA